ncbi:MAG: hypothetical protein A3B74_04620 [Candidatus Kerfeldbacteria bacterium RIFCSPHIGHO2_02_FULL_42_14]|uniref:HMA domain-containing protein n=1 Tax=Candidatus Kerfeldbacteria bacterium RIFCSPHIGHO2_02_FULL_42_14 TaxID=1798540 RepID=A0A1G2ANZ4_9BACT|nr:MAG: hypothetical protein A3B74_04620 [Candidatus Kerfeldbacteria bacterium RIFCSPHIGHO2_02_FULL_42_14]OGY81010.1 MAG: hypothetical protein A3E60_03340 [Candidatus Kerfeldbacteria bacterium RIFCSPHIGHO2_12_FULL_42_13]OGY84956.1 MAG: hypothetical protein A3I91_00535 [Candidatus Kerfeldbacteria bacterium RIFCSPLOWO2_02_FULL_42_19]OGY86123.1 MAG: hypothetical protein A3G01_02065 [Candidatus Kerfeldbacteria bacterium RIFCSPLOWO2_12_FULL_43_9]
MLALLGFLIGKNMNENPEWYISKFFVSALTNEKRAEEIKKIIQSSIAVEKLDVNLHKRLVRIITSESVDVKKLRIKLVPHGFHLEERPMSAETYGNQVHVASEKRSEHISHNDPLQYIPANQGYVRIEGMTCHSCEVLIERQWKKLPGVQKVTVNAATGRARLVSDGGPLPSIDQLQTLLGNEKYRVHAYERGKGKIDRTQSVPQGILEGRPSLGRLVGLFAAVFFIGYLLSRLGLFQTNISFTDKLNFGTVFVIGLVAAASSCIAVAGGLMLSAVSRFNQRYQGATRLARMRPVIMFVTGRVLGYGFFGGLLGVVGQAITPSPVVTGFLILLAALYMLVMGMEMLHIAPAWLKRFLPRMPKGLSHRIMDAESKNHPFMPFLLGAGTFFLPCGFTQALQLYALTTGSFSSSALTLFAFALGTAPSLLALGWASGSLKGKAGKLFFQFSGALVIVLGVWNIQNSLNLMGYPLSFGNVPSSASAETPAPAAALAEGTTQGGSQDVQVVKMNVAASGYSPSRLTVRAGTKVRWEVDGTNAYGCASVLVSRKLGIQKLLQPGINLFEFTPTEPGEIAFSCSMGMYRGSFTVLPAA